MWERTDVVHLGWWASGGPLVSLSGLRELIYSLRELLPEAVPSRWDVDEDYRHRLVDEGLDGLVGFINFHRWDVLLRAKAPARTIDLYAVPPTDKDGELQVTCLAVELDAKVLDGKGAQRLPDAFEQIVALIEPFYAEAVCAGRGEIRRIAAPRPPAGRGLPLPVERVVGTPDAAPVAAMLGDAYRERWPEFRTAEIAGLAVENPRPWHRAMEPLAWPVFRSVPGVRPALGRAGAPRGRSMERRVRAHDTRCSPGRLAFR